MKGMGRLNRRADRLAKPFDRTVICKYCGAMCEWGKINNGPEKTARFLMFKNGKIHKCDRRKASKTTWQLDTRKWNQEQRDDVISKKEEG